MNKKILLGKIVALLTVCLLVGATFCGCSKTAEDLWKKAGDVAGGAVDSVKRVGNQVIGAITSNDLAGTWIPNKLIRADGQEVIIADGIVDEFNAIHSNGIVFEFGLGSDVSIRVTGTIFDTRLKDKAKCHYAIDGSKVTISTPDLQTIDMQFDSEQKTLSLTREDGDTLIFKKKNVFVP